MRLPRVRSTNALTHMLYDPRSHQVEAIGRRDDANRLDIDRRDGVGHRLGARVGTGTVKQREPIKHRNRVIDD